MWVIKIALGERPGAGAIRGLLSLGALPAVGLPLMALAPVLIVLLDEGRQRGIGARATTAHRSRSSAPAG